MTTGEDKVNVAERSPAMREDKVKNEAQAKAKAKAKEEAVFGVWCSV